MLSPLMIFFPRYLQMFVLDPFFYNVFLYFFSSFVGFLKISPFNTRVQGFFLCSFFFNNPTTELPLFLSAHTLLHPTVPPRFGLYLTTILVALAGSLVRYPPKYCSCLYIPFLSPHEFQDSVTQHLWPKLSSQEGLNVERCLQASGGYSRQSRD